MYRLRVVSPGRPCYTRRMTTNQNGVIVTLRKIPGVPDKYRAGSDGRIYTSRRPARLPPLQFHDWRPIFTRPDTRGYPVVYLLCTGDGRRKSFPVHRLICMAWHGLAPTDQYYEVRHLDGDRANPTPENLAWGTHADNWNDRRRHGRVSYGERHPQSKVSDAVRVAVWTDIVSGAKYKDIAEKHAVPYAFVVAMKKRGIANLRQPG